MMDLVQRGREFVAHYGPKQTVCHGLVEALTDEVARLARELREAVVLYEVQKAEVARLSRREENLVGLLTYVRMEVTRITGVQHDEPSDVVDTVRNLLADAESSRAEVARLREAMALCSGPCSQILAAQEVRDG